MKRAARGMAAAGLGMMLGVAAAAGALPLQVSALSPAETAAVQDFDHRVAAYERLLKDAESRSPRLKATASPAALAAAREAIAEQVRAARAGARPGDILQPPIAGFDRRRLAACMAGPEGEKIRASLRNANPVPDARVEVNRPYPSPTPLQSMPAGLLVQLPLLPKGLEYRLVGRTLILYDTATNLVVDMEADAMPRP